MTIPKIVQVAGSRSTEYVILACTGCHEYYSYSVRQYKGDFGCNISEFEHFLMWAKCEAAKHECFLAGRVGYLVEPEVDAAIAEVLAHTTEPELELLRRSAVNPLLQGNAPDGTPYDDLDEEDEFWPDEACMSHEECDMEPCIYAGETLEEEGELFHFLYGEPTKFKTHGAVTGRINQRWPIGIFEVQEMPPRYEGKMVYIEFDYADLERRVVDQMLLDQGIYSLDDHGCLRDEKGRCLACLRPGLHLPFYWKRDHGLQ